MRHVLTSLAVTALFASVASVAVAGDPGSDLARGLRHPLASARQNAAEAIGDQGIAARPEVDALLDAMRDESVDVRRAAIGSLGRIGFTADRAEQLLPALNDHDWVVREGVAKLLATSTFRDKTSIDAVLVFLKSDEWSVRRTAAIALSGARPDDDSLFATIVKALSDRMLNDEHWQVRTGAAYAIGKQGRRAQGALPDLFDVLRYDEPMVAEAAIEAIGRVGPTGLDVALTDSFPSVRLGAARIIGTLGVNATDVVPVLAKGMSERSIPMRRTAALALGAVGPAASSSVPALLAGLKDTDWSVRWASARALGKLGSGAAAAVPAVADALRDPDSRVCEAAAFALEGIGPAARDSVAALAQAAREQPSETCKMIDVTAATQESQMDLGWTVRWASARALGAVGGDASRTRAALQAALSDSMWQVRGVAALSLGRVSGAPTAKILAGALSDEVAPVRKAAALALGELGRDARDVLPGLTRLLDDSDTSVRDATRSAIVRIRGS